MRVLYFFGLVFFCLCVEVVSMWWFNVVFWILNGWDRCGFDVGC